MLLARVQAARVPLAQGVARVVGRRLAARLLSPVPIVILVVVLARRLRTSGVPPLRAVAQFAAAPVLIRRLVALHAEALARRLAFTSRRHVDRLQIRVDLCLSGAWILRTRREMSDVRVAALVARRVMRLAAVRIVLGLRLCCPIPIAHFSAFSQRDLTIRRRLIGLKPSSVTWSFLPEGRRTTPLS